MTVHQLTLWNYSSGIIAALPNFAAALVFRPESTDTALSTLLCNAEYPDTMLDTNLREVIKTGASNLLPYDRYGKPVADMFWLPLSGEPLNGQYECFLLRMEAGARSKPHRHMGFEEFLVLEGSLVDADGTEYVSGDFVRLMPGSMHSSYSPNGLFALVILRGNNLVLDESDCQ